MWSERLAKEKVGFILGHAQILAWLLCKQARSLLPAFNILKGGVSFVVVKLRKRFQLLN